ncbi:MAG: lipoyl synthase [Eubacteriales bacterium]|nr:lipoyl synthase [Eubacteriales bacterium]
MRDRRQDPNAFPTIAKPKWLKVSYNSAETQEVVELMDRYNLNTVCKEANCPNLGECYKAGTATFMILGDICTRVCRFCNICYGRPRAVDIYEAKNLAAAAKKLGLLHVVITSVTRDDLPDGGASQFVRVVEELHKALPESTVELLISDLMGNWEALESILEAGPDVLNHNVETVPELYADIRPQGIYERSLEMLERASKWAHANPLPQGRMLVKTGLMLGLGETDEQLRRVFHDLVERGVDVLTLGQYLRPTPTHAPVKRYVSPEDFDRYKEEALAAGLRFVASSPFVRSSYRAEEALRAVRNQD